MPRLTTYFTSNPVLIPDKYQVLRTDMVEILLDDMVSYILMVNWEIIYRDSVRRRHGHYEVRR